MTQGSMGWEQGSHGRMNNRQQVNLILSTGQQDRFQPAPGGAAEKNIETLDGIRSRVRVLGGGLPSP